MWRDSELGIHLSQWGAGNRTFVVPEDPAVDITSIERAVAYGVLVPLKAPSKTKKTKPAASEPKAKNALAEPTDLIKHTAPHLIKNILGRCGINTLEILLQLEAAGKNQGSKARKSVIKALMRELKQRGVNEAIVYNDADEIVWQRQFDKETNFPGEPPDEHIKKKTQDLKSE